MVIHLKKSVKAAMCGLAAALSVVFMFLGGLFYVFAYVVPILLSILITIIKKTFGTSSALTVYIATSILSLILVSDKECVMMYLLFFGYYPLIKPHIEKVKLKVIAFVLKLLLFNSALLLIELICVYVFRIPFFEDNGFSVAILILFAAAMNFIFIVYDCLLKISILLYEKKLEKRLKNIFK